MQSGIVFLIEQQREKYRSDMASWAASIRMVRGTLPAMQAAKREPQRGPLLRGLSSITNSYRIRALREIDRVLSERLQAVEGQEKAECYRLAQSFTDYPGVIAWMRSEQRRKAADRHAERQVAGRL